MSDEQLSYEDLLVDEEALSEDLLTETLIDFVKIGGESGNLVPEDAFEDLTNREKVTVVLLTQHALEGLDMADEAWLTPTEIAERSGIKKGSVYPVVRELDEAGIAESDDGSYRIPTHNLGAAKRVIRKEDD